jgi:uncharacterized membrane protein YdbT with pleckstrin-like domain
VTNATIAEPRAHSNAVLQGVRRPVPALMNYYALESLLAGPGIIIMLPYRFFRYKTLHYVFDSEGLTVRWGLLFRREVSLTYARIQDIHLVSNVFERWLGLGRVQIQTASGQSSAEVTIEGLPDFEAVRDELYRRMRGARGQHTTNALQTGKAAVAIAPSSDQSDIVAALNDAVAELRALREEIAMKRGP